MNSREHGGWCCGMRHIMSFPRVADERGKAELDAVIERCSQANRRGNAIEAVLTLTQKLTWGRILEEKGFREVFVWQNKNTASELHLYMGLSQ